MDYQRSENFGIGTSPALSPKRTANSRNAGCLKKEATGILFNPYLKSNR